MLRKMATKLDYSTFCAFDGKSRLLRAFRLLFFLGGGVGGDASRILGAFSALFDAML